MSMINHPISFTQWQWNNPEKYQLCLSVYTNGCAMITLDLGGASFTEYWQYCRRDITQLLVCCHCKWSFLYNICFYKCLAFMTWYVRAQHMYKSSSRSNYCRVETLHDCIHTYQGHKTDHVRLNQTQITVKWFRWTFYKPWYNPTKTQQNSGIITSLVLYFNITCDIRQPMSSDTATGYSYGHAQKHTKAL